MVSGAVYRLATVGPGVILAGNCGLQRSVDGGRSWTQVLSCGYPDPTSDLFQNVLRIWADPAEPDLLYTHVLVSNSTHPHGYSAWKSTDRGITWKELPLTNPEFLAVAPGDSRVLYAWESTKMTLERSRDAGRTWQVVNNQSPGPFDGYSSLAVDARDPDTVYLGTYQKLLWSRDGGRTLKLFDDSTGVVAVITDRVRPGTLFIQPGQGGLFEREVGE